eukprot:m.449102 g.449102  ORF g.449102 m.449102 type:complete len:227 (-) comp19770_c0_seq1:1844-2524(-)
MSTTEGSAAKKPRLDTTDETGEAGPAVQEESSSRKRLRLAVVCSSNQNRSMEAHRFLARKGFQVESFGSGQHVKIPGPTADQPNVYEFGKQTYEDIYQDLVAKDKEKYAANGMLDMVDRNRKIKRAPERFQDTDKKFDVIVCCEARVFDQVTQGLEEREQETFEPVHVCNLEIKDNHESATLGALHIVSLCEMLEEVEDLENDIDEVLQSFEEKNKEPVLHSVAFY